MKEGPGRKEYQLIFFLFLQSGKVLFKIALRELFLKIWSCIDGFECDEM